MSTATVPSSDVIEAMDFDPEVFCESPSCCREKGEHPGRWWGVGHCPGVWAVCDAVAEEIRNWTRGYYCPRCWVFLPVSPQRILGPVRSP